MARYRFWFHDKDKKGQPLDADILKAAEEIAPMLTRYRQQEIDCESTSNEILQAAVEAASKATRKNRIANPAGYLASVYKRFVDKSLEHKKKLISVDDVFLEDLANSEHAPSFEEWMHNRLFLEQLLDLIERDGGRLSQPQCDQLLHQHRHWYHYGFDCSRCQSDQQRMVKPEDCSFAKFPDAR